MTGVFSFIYKNRKLKHINFIVPLALAKPGTRLLAGDNSLPIALLLLAMVACKQPPTKLS